MKIISGIIKFIAISGMGIVVLIYLITTRSWKNFEKPLELAAHSRPEKDTVVTFHTKLTDTLFTINDSDGEPSYYFFKGNVHGEPLIVYVHKNFVRQITTSSANDTFLVIGKVELPEKEALEHFGSNLVYVELLREDYKSDTIGLFLFSLFLIGLGSIIPIYLFQRYKRTTQSQQP